MTGQCTFQEATEHEEAVVLDLYARVMMEYIIEIWDWNQKWQENNFRKTSILKISLWQGRKIQQLAIHR